MTRILCVGALAASLLGAAGCNPTYAPPIRAVQYGAPARLEAGRVELGGTAGGMVIPEAGGPHLGVGVTDWLAVEVGGNFNALDTWSMGFLGTRFSFHGDRRRRAYFIGDVELGVGAGLGGSLEGNQSKLDCNYCDGLKANQRVAYGGYQGAGLGVRIRWFSIFGRVRVEESRATNIPLTYWPSASVGMEFRPHDRVALGVGAGLMAYTNSRDREMGFFYQLGVTIFFDKAARPPVVETWTPGPPPPPPPPLLAPCPPAPAPPAPPAAEPWAPRPPLTPVPPPPPVPDPFEEDDTTYD